MFVVDSSSVENQTFTGEQAVKLEVVHQESIGKFNLLSRICSYKDWGPSLFSPAGLNVLKSSISDVTCEKGPKTPVTASLHTLFSACIALIDS